MSKLSDEGGNNGDNPAAALNKFLDELEAVMGRHPGVTPFLEVLVGLRKTPGNAKSAAAAGPAADFAGAFAAKAQCTPACVPPKKCFIQPGHGTVCK